jgi:hypothetical protein
VSWLWTAATAGTRTDRLRFGLTAIGAALTTFVLLAAATVRWVSGWDGVTFYPDGARSLDPYARRYASLLLNTAPGRTAVVVFLLLLTIPAVVFTAQGARLGAPARDRRLAALRLAGATPGQTRLVVAAETTLSGLAGALVGTVAYFVVRALANHPVLADPNTDWDFPEMRPVIRPVLPLPTDVVLPVWILVAIGLMVPVLVAGFSLVALRRVVVSPLGVARRTPRRRLHWWPLFLVGFGLALIPVQLAMNMADISGSSLVAWASLPVTAVGVALSSAPLGQLAARLAVRAAHRPALLLAARRILADPWHGGRSIAVILVSTGLAALSLTTLAALHADGMPDGLWVTDGGIRALALAALVGSLLTAGGGLLCALVDGTVARRRTLVALVAAGTPRTVLARVVAWQALLPAVPAVVLAVAVGYLAPRLAAVGNAFAFPLPWRDLTAVGLGGLLTVVLAVTLSLPALRASTEPAELRTE